MGNWQVKWRRYSTSILPLHIGYNRSVADICSTYSEIQGIEKCRDQPGGDLSYPQRSAAGSPAQWLGPDPSPLWVSVCFSGEWQMGRRCSHTSPSPSPLLIPLPSPSLLGSPCRYQSLRATCVSQSGKSWPTASWLQNVYIGQVRE